MKVTRNAQAAESKEEGPGLNGRSFLSGLGFKQRAAALLDHVPELLLPQTPSPPSQPLRSSAPTPGSPLATFKGPHGGSSCNKDPQRRQLPSRRTDTLHPSRPRTTLETGSGAAGAHRDSSSRAALRRTGATGRHLAPRHSVTTMASPTLVFSWAEHLTSTALRCSPSCPDMTANL